jgi:mono/diheme cytochrome c family protein
LATSIREGKGTAMPSFGDKLGEGQVRDVIAYIRSFGSAKAPSIAKPSTDFRRRFDRLRDELEQLDRQYRALSGH